MKSKLRLVLALFLPMCVTLQMHAHEWRMWGSLRVPRAFGYVAQISPTQAIAIGGIPDFVPGSQTFGTWVTRSCEILDVATGLVSFTDSTKVGHADGCMVRMSNGRIVVLGGVTDGDANTTTLVEEYNPTTRKWTTKGNLLKKRRQQQAIALDATRVMIACGRDQNSLGGTSDIEIFDLATGQCKLVAKHPHPITNHKLMMADSSVYLIGGREGAPRSDRFADVYRYDENTNQWVFAFNLPGPKPLFEGINVYNGMYTTGGAIDLDDTQFSDTVYFIDRLGARPLQGRHEGSVKGHCFAQWMNDSLISFGGENASQASSTGSSWINTISGIVTAGPSLNIGRRYGSTVYLPGDGATPAAVFAICGVTSSNEVTPTIEIITGANCSRTPFSSMFDPSSITTVGSARRTNTPSIVLTNNTTYNAGAVWWKNKVSLQSGLSIAFSFRLAMGSDNAQPDGGPPGADGVALVIQNSSPNPLGATGQGIGYEEIPNAIAVEFDAYLNAAYSDPSGSHVAVQAQRDKKIKPWHRDGHMLGITHNVVPLRSDGTVYFARVDFSGSSIEVYLDTVSSFTVPVLTVSGAAINDLISLGLDGAAWVGITSATGFSAQEHELLSWQIEGCQPGVTAIENGSDDAESIVPRIRPFPSSDQASLFWDAIHTNGMIDVFDLHSNRVLTQVVQSGEFATGVNLRASELPTGVYCVRASAAGNVLSLLWLIQR